MFEGSDAWPKVKGREEYPVQCVPLFLPDGVTGSNVKTGDPDMRIPTIFEDKGHKTRSLGDRQKKRNLFGKEETSYFVCLQFQTVDDRTRCSEFVAE